MTTIYFISAKNIGELQHWVQHYLSSINPGVNTYSLNLLYSDLVNQHYLKLCLVNTLVTDRLYDDLRQASLQQRFDFFIKPATLPAQGLIAFDMDSTFVQEEGVDEIARALGISEHISALTRQAMEGRLDFDTSFTQRIQLLKGTPLTLLHDVCARMTISPGISRILPLLRHKGFKTAIISGGLDIFTQGLQQKYQIDYVFSNTLEMENNVLTGNVKSPIMNAQLKQQTLHQLALSLQLAPHQIIACGDGANDLPMLAHAGTGIAWKAKPKVRSQIRNQINFHGFESLLFFIDDKL